MPLEIRELIIKVTVATDAAKQGSSFPDDKALRHWKEGIIKECIDKILNRVSIEADR